MGQEREDYADPDSSPGGPLSPVKLAVLLSVVASLVGLAGWFLYRIALAHP
jgi:hypothetical protein